MVALHKADETREPAPPAPAPAAPAVPWRAALAALGLAWAAVIGLLWPAAASMVDVWWVSSTYNHGFLIAPAAFYLAWEQRAALARLAPRPAPVALIVVLGAALAWFAGDVTRVNVVSHAALVVALQAATVAVLGWRVCRLLAFPIGFLLFAVPFGDFLVPPLQDLTAEFVVAGLQIIGIPVYLDGIFLQIPNGRFEVAEACSGVRFLIAMIALGTLVAYMFMHSWRRRLLFMAIACAVPIVANGFRALGIVVIGHVSDMTVAVGADHLIYGWFFFAVVMALVLLLGWWMREAPARHAEPVPEGRPARAAAFALTAVAVALVAAIGPAAARLTDAPTDAPAVNLAPLPGGAGWVATDPAEPAWQPRFEGADASALVAYGKGDDRVEAFVAYYAVQRHDAELLSYRNALYDGKAWRRAGGGRAAVIVDGAAIDAAQVRLLSRRAGRLVWSWYWVDGHFTADPLLAKLYHLRAVLTGGGHAMAIVAIAADYVETPAEARATLERFVADLGPLGPWLAGAEP